MKYKYLIIFMLISLLPSCLEKITFERPDSIKGAVSIQGKLIKDNPSQVQVIIKDVFDFFNSPRFLSASQVYVVDEVGNELRLTTKRQGFYTLDIPTDHSFFKVEYGKKYKIRVENLKGTDFESDFDELFPTPVPDDFYVQETTINFLDQLGYTKTFDQLNFYISTPLGVQNSTGNSRLVWEIEGVSKVSDTPIAGGCRIEIDPEPKSCYVSYPPVKNYLTFDGVNSTASRIDDILVNESNYSNLFAEGYYMIIYQQAVSQAAFEYWNQVSTVVNRTGDVFQEPTGVVPTNWTNLNDPKDNIYGFFYAAEQKIVRQYISPEFGRGQPPQCPIRGLGGELAEFCCDCLVLENSTVEQPDWWIE